MSARRLLCQLLLLLSAASVCSFAGGPMIVGGPAYGKDGQPFTWNPVSMPIRYRVDPGPLSANASGQTVISNDAALTRVQAMFGLWQSISTAAISFSNAGPLLPTSGYLGGDVRNLPEFNAIQGSCRNGEQSPVVFDATGGLMTALGLPPEVIGFAGACDTNGSTGYILSALLVMNGSMQDGVSNFDATPPNLELTANEFDEAIAHEIGHFIGLDHSQINLDLLTNYHLPCEVDGLAGLPLMFPEAICQARKDAGLPTLSPDDAAWVSTLYPAAAFTSNYGSISGTIYFPDGISQAQGANVIARMVDDPYTPEDESRRVAVSVVSGYQFTGNPGQHVSGDNAAGSLFGSRDPLRIGYYRIMLPPGTYTVQVESVYYGFVSDSGLGPLGYPAAIPGPKEFWSQDESAFDLPLQRDTITVHVGDNITGIDIILNGLNDRVAPPRFDQYEDSGGLLDPPWPAPLAALEVWA